MARFTKNYKYNKSFFVDDEKDKTKDILNKFYFASEIDYNKTLKIIYLIYFIYSILNRASWTVSHTSFSYNNFSGLV